MFLNHLLTLTLIHCGQKLALVVASHMTNTRTQASVNSYSESHMTHELKSQEFLISCILTHASFKTRSLWSFVQRSVQENIFNFTIRYLNSTLATRNNICKWPISQSSACSFCLLSESPAVSRILKMADILGTTTRSFSFLPECFSRFPIAYYLPISFLFFSKCHHW